MWSEISRWFEGGGEDDAGATRRQEETLKRVWSATSNYASLVTGLCRVQPSERLGHRHDGFAELWEHKFFRGIRPAQLNADAAPWRPPPFAGASAGKLRHLDDDEDDEHHAPGDFPPLSFLPAF